MVQLALQPPTSSVAGGSGVPDAPPIVRKSAYAKMRGWSPAYVSKLIRLGKLSGDAITADDLINVAHADQQLKAVADPSHALGPALPLPQPSLGGMTVDPEPANFAAHKARRESSLADLAEIDLARKRNELVDRESVADVFYEMGVLVRDGLEARRRELALSLVGLDEAAIATVLQVADRKLLEQFAETAKQKAGTLQDA